MEFLEYIRWDIIAVGCLIGAVGGIIAGCYDIYFKYFRKSE